MYAEHATKFAEARPIEIVPDLLGHDMAEARRQEDDNYHRQENYLSSSYNDIWRDNQCKPSSSGDVMTRSHDVASRSYDMTSRSPLTDYGYSGALPLSSIELEPLSGVFSFSTGYKDFPVFKEKGPADSHVADALLSLKHAVVHPSQMNGPLSPLSPTLTSLQPSGGSSMGQMGTFSYNVGPHGGAHVPSGGFGSGGGGGCGSNQYFDQPSPGQTMNSQYQPHCMFPSMSVNVSMSMNVGIPPNLGSCAFPEHGQWGAAYGHQSVSPNSGSSHCNPPHAMTSQPPQYSPYGAPVAPPATYHTSYTLADLRSPNFATKDVLYRNPVDPYKSNVTRFYSLNPLSMRRSKMSGGRGNSAIDNSKINLCRICGKTYARPSTLKTHMRTHSGEKPYRCSSCNKSFSQAANLTAHVRTHSGEKPFRCPVCERRFSQSSSVTTHMRTHSGERPYRCRMCKKAFSDSSTLTKHLRIHSGEKPYQCKLCLLRFSQSGNLNRHMRVHASNA